MDFLRTYYTYNLLESADAEYLEDIDYDATKALEEQAGQSASIEDLESDSDIFNLEKFLIKYGYYISCLSKTERQDEFDFPEVLKTDVMKIHHIGSQAEIVIASFLDVIEEEGVRKIQVDFHSIASPTSRYGTTVGNKFTVDLDYSERCHCLWDELSKEEQAKLTRNVLQNIQNAEESY